MARMKRDGNASTSPDSPDTSGGTATARRVKTKESEGASPWYRVSGWRLRNKIALALAFPVVSASWFATDKALEAFAVQHSHEATAGQVRVLAPALDFLYAAENSYVQTLQTPPGSRQRKDAIDQVEKTAEALRKASASEALTENQRIQVKNLVEWAEDLKDTDIIRVATASNSQASQLHSGVSDYFQSIVEDQVVPEATLQQISYVMDGHIALTQQQIYTEYDDDEIKNQPELLQYIGIERGAIESIADGRPAGDPDATNLRAQNVQRQSVVTIGEGKISYRAALELYRAINAAVLDEAVEALDKNAEDARGKALLNLWILTLTHLITLLFAWLIVRLILKPVRRVRDGALAVANEQLPRAVAQIRAGQDPGEIRPVDVHTDEEMGQLARAVDDLHRTAVNLASGEAKLRSQIGEMFVTLSRRNTSLINQQLGLIEALERDEQDPRRLENLFRLDHLAARMRRTAESLVILSDAPVRQREAAPLAITDVLQAATAGVQEYQRVELRGASPAQLEGAVASDVVHLLTELIDNALSFSPPTAPVQVTTTADSSAVTIAISDGGLGMPADMLSQLNEMLAAQVGITPDAARRMGLFVVSRLAQRHGIAVSLSENGRGGVTATVTIPTIHVVGGASALPDATPAASPATSSPVDAPVAAEPTPVAEPVIAAEPVIPAVATAAPAATKPDPLSDPLGDPVGDPLTDPLPVAEDTVSAAAAAAAEADAKPAPKGLGSLPKRRPGATVPTRAAAVNPTGASLFTGEQKSSGGFFTRPGEEPAAASPAPAAEPTPVEPEQGGTPAPEPLTVTEAVEPPTAEVADAPEPAPVASATETPKAPKMPSIPLRSLPPLDADVPFTPATTGESGSLFGSGDTDSRVAAPRNPDENPTAAARMGMFNALARGPVRNAPARLPASGDPEPSASSEEPAASPEAPQAPASSWLGQGDGDFSNSAADAGWEAAEKVAKHVETERTPAGLPQRRPGQRLVPGAVAQSRTLPPRDPEAIRRRLASHAAGVSRGRTATVNPTNRAAQEEGQA